jgi:hypothetical protein
MVFETRETEFQSEGARLTHHFALTGLEADGTDRVRIRLIARHEEGLGEYSDISTVIIGETGTSYGTAGLNWMTRNETFASKTPDAGDFVEWEATGYV